MILEINDPGWDFTSMFIAGGVALLVLVFGVLLYLRVRDTMSENDTFAMGTTFVVVATTIFLMGGVVTGNSVHAAQVRETKVAGLEELGFDQVHLSGDTFTASRDGAYFSGILLEGEKSNTWQVAEVLPPVPVEAPKDDKK